MLFRQDQEGFVSISQPAHAWISGQLLRAWRDELPEALLLAAEQHDLAWLDWEVEPSFDVKTGRPHLFRDIGASLHAPMWMRGVDRALEAWGTHVALLLSRHGGVIYKRFATRHRLDEADARAAARYLETQAPREATWAAALGLSLAELERQSALIAVVDMLSLALCGELKAPLEIEAPDEVGGQLKLDMSENPARPFEFSLSPWPFRVPHLSIAGEGRRLPEAGRFPDEPAFRKWLAEAERTRFEARLVQSFAAG
jgi:hypothetical protein